MGLVIVGIHSLKEGSSGGKVECVQRPLNSRASLPGRSIIHSADILRAYCDETSGSFTFLTLSQVNDICDDGGGIGYHKTPQGGTSLAIQVITPCF